MKRVLGFVFVMIFLGVSASAQTGVVCEYWMGATLSNPQDLANNPSLLGNPTSRGPLPTTGFLAQSNKSGAPFVARCIASLNVPVTGNYTFWVAANKLATAWLGTTTDFAGQNPLCRVSASFPTPLALQWTRNLEQKSVPVALIAGANYYLQVIHVATTSVNHLAVGWMLPNGAYERPIPNSRLWQITVDSIPPTVAITSPTYLQYISGTLNITATASDDIGVVGVQFRVNGENYGQEVTTPPYSLSVDTAGMIDGLYVLSAVARDNAGNSTLSSGTTILLTNDPETVDNPTTAEFDPSADHDATVGDPPVPAVTNYELAFFFVGATDPVSHANIGKPGPDPDGKIRFNFTSTPDLIGVPLGWTYQAKIQVVGPEGSSWSSFSNIFVFTR